MAKGKKTAGSGGRIRRGLEGHGPTPKAEDRPYHKAYAAKQAKARRAGGGQTGAKARPAGDWVVGRNPVLEALLAELPVKTAYLAEGVERDDRLRDILKYAAGNSIALLQVSRGELDRLTGGATHQGVALQLPDYEYADLSELLDDPPAPGDRLVACDQITDPHNLGAIIRSAAAFSSRGVIIPARRSARLTPAAWKASAGAAARLPVAQVTNLNRALEECAAAGWTIVGLAGEADTAIGEIESDRPVVLVVGSEADGLSRLVRQHCDYLAAIPIASSVESLNASVAAAIGLYELSGPRA